MECVRQLLHLTWLGGRKTLVEEDNCQFEKSTVSVSVPTLTQINRSRMCSDFGYYILAPSTENKNRQITLVVGNMMQ